MASTNKKTTGKTHEGAPAKNITPIQELERSIMSCMLWEDEFYEDGKSIADRIKALVKTCDADDVIRVTLRAKNDMRLRHIPLLLARELFRKKDHRKAAGVLLSNCITRADDIPEFLALYWKENKDEPLAKQAKVALGKAFHKFDEYQLAKYNGGSKAIKLVDALRIVHPEKSELLGKLRRGELNTPDTWEVRLSAGGDKKENWTTMLKEGTLGGMALLRNLRNMTEAGVDRKLIKEAIAKINPGRLVPINFVNAGIHNPAYEQDVEDMFFKSFKKEKVKGHTIVLVDTSGSMDGLLSIKSTVKRKDVAASLAMIAKETFEDCRVFCFSDSIQEIPARHGFALRDLINKADSGGTNLGYAITHALKQKCDRLVVLTDEQSADRVPDFKGYMINVASNRHGVGYGQCVHIDGWSDKVIDYIIEYEKGESDAKKE